MSKLEKISDEELLQEVKGRFRKKVLIEKLSLEVEDFDEDDIFDYLESFDSGDLIDSLNLEIGNFRDCDIEQYYKLNYQNLGVFELNGKTIIESWIFEKIKELLETQNDHNVWDKIKNIK